MTNASFFLHCLASCGKDNRTILWDLYALRPIADVPNDTPAPQEDTNNGQNGTMFGTSGLASVQQRRYDIQWSPLKRGVLATSSLDRKVQVHSTIGLATKSGRPPKWMKPSSSVSFSHGGTYVSCGNTDKIVRINKVVEQPDLVAVSNAFESEIESNNVVDFCVKKAAAAKSQQDQATWGFMQVIFAANARQELIKHLGFDAEKIAEAAQQFTEEANGGADGKPEMSKLAEETVKKALLVGNYEAAVECCFRAGNLADALLLASCGGGDLWHKTQQRFFESEAPKRPFLSIVRSVIHNQLDDIVTNSDPRVWTETLAILSTYAQSDQFPRLCIALGDKVESSGDQHAANLCYLCSLSLEHSVKFWLSEFKAATKTKGSTNMLALHEFVIKVTVFLKAVGNRAELSGEVSDLFAEYAGALADQGLLVTAAKYCRYDSRRLSTVLGDQVGDLLSLFRFFLTRTINRGESESCKMLRDRLYRSRSSQACLQILGTPPPFPYSMEIKRPTIKAAAAPAPAPAAAQPAATNGQQQQQAAAQPQRSSYANHTQAAQQTQAASAPMPAPAPAPAAVS